MRELENLNQIGKGLIHLSKSLCVECEIKLANNVIINDVSRLVTLYSRGIADNENVVPVHLNLYCNAVMLFALFL